MRVLKNSKSTEVDEAAGCWASNATMTGSKAMVGINGIPPYLFGISLPSSAAEDNSFPSVNLQNGANGKSSCAFSPRLEFDIFSRAFFNRPELTSRISRFAPDQLTQATGESKLPSQGTAPISPLFSR